MNLHFDQIFKVRPSFKKINQKENFGTIMVFCGYNKKLKAMKTLKIILGLSLFISALLFTSACSKLDRPAELSIDVQTLEFNNDVLTRKFNIVNIGDELLHVEISANKEWVTVIGNNANLGHAATSIVSVQIHPEFFQEYGQYTASLSVQSNGGNFVVPIVVDYTQSAMPILAMDLDYLKFAKNSTGDYFTLYNDGTEALNFLLQSDASWLQFSPEVGTISSGSEQRINVTVDRTGLYGGVYAAEISITSNGGNAILNVDMDVNVYSITFFNPVYTPIEIQSPAFDPAIIDPGERFSYVFNNNPLSFQYSASTIGETDNGDPLGVRILWDETIDVSAYDAPTFNLNVSADYFFMAVKNSGNYYLDLWSVNYGTDYQVDDDFFIPNDGVEYGVAYYDAFTDTDIYARLSGTSDDVVWRQGIEFLFPWTDNQYILLENNFKKSAVARPNLKASSKVPSKVNQFVKPIEKPKGSIDLYNKK